MTELTSICTQKVSMELDSVDIKGHCNEPVTYVQCQCCVGVHKLTVEGILAGQCLTG